MHDLRPILEHVPPALMVIFRLGGLMVFAPMYGSVAIPVRVKVFLAVVLGLAVYPLIGPRLQGAPWELDLFGLAAAIAAELSIGLLIGFLATIPLVAIQLGGLLASQQMGLGFARFFNPAINDDADLLGQILLLSALAGFLLIGGHESLFLAILHSFEHIPLGAGIADMRLVSLLTGMLGAALEVSLRVAAPVLTLLFMQSLALGFVSKTVPQLNILTLGFPLRILAGLLMVFLGLVVMDDVAMDFIDETLVVIFQWIEAS